MARTPEQTAFATALATPAHRAPAEMRTDMAAGATMLAASGQQLAAWDAALAALEFAETDEAVRATLPALRQQLGAMARLRDRQLRDLRDFDTALREFETRGASTLAVLPTEGA